MSIGLLEDLLKLARSEGGYLISFAVNSEEVSIEGMTGTPHGTATWRVRASGVSPADALKQALLLIPEERARRVAAIAEADKIKSSFRTRKTSSAKLSLSAEDLLKQLGLE